MLLRTQVFLPSSTSCQCDALLHISIIWPWPHLIQGSATFPRNMREKLKVTGERIYTVRNKDQCQAGTVLLGSARFCPTDTFRLCSPGYALFPSTIRLHNNILSRCLIRHFQKEKNVLIKKMQASIQFIIYLNPVYKNISFLGQISKNVEPINRWEQEKALRY